MPDVNQLLTEIQAKSAETHQMVTDFQKRDEAREKELKGAVARQDGLITEVQKNLTDAITKNAEIIQNMQAALEETRASNSKAEELKYYSATLQPSSKEAKAHLSTFLKSGMLDLNAGAAMHDMARKDLSVNDNPNGGYLVTAQMASFITTRVFEGNPLRTLARQETITNGDALSIPLDDQDFGASWVGETQARINTTNATLGEIRIDAHELYASVPMTLKMIEDANIDIENWVSSKASDKFARTEGTAFVSGDGVGKPRGLLTYANWSAAGTYTSGAVEQVNLGNASALTADGLIRLQNSLVEERQGNANWMMKRSTYGAAMLLKDSQNRYLFNNLPNSDGVFNFGLLGKKVYLGDDMPTVAANALSVAYGDFRAGYCIVDRVGITLLRDPFSTQGQVIAKLRKRVGGGVIAYDAIKIGKISA